MRQTFSRLASSSAKTWPRQIARTNFSTSSGLVRISSPEVTKPLPKKRLYSAGVISRTATPRWFRIAASAVEAE
jgi:hypothetical protein